MDGEDEPVFFQLCTGKVKAGNEAKLKTWTHMDWQGKPAEAVTAHID